MGLILSTPDGSTTVRNIGMILPHPAGLPALLKGMRSTAPFRPQHKYVRVSQTKAAKAMGISLSTLRNWEHGRSEPTVSEFLRLADFYGSMVILFDKIQQ